MWVGEVRPGTGLKTAASLAKGLSDDLRKQRSLIDITNQ